MMRKLPKVLVALTIAGWPLIGGQQHAQADPTPTAPAQEKQATGGEKSAAAPAPAPAGEKSSAAPASGPPYDDPNGTVEAGPFQESTNVRGKIDTKLSGIWLVVARTQIAPGKFKTFPQIIKITQGKDGPQFNLLDVKLPDEVDKAVYDANNMTLAMWTPSPEVREKLSKTWAQLPPHKQKNLHDFLYSKIEYTLIGSDIYGEVFTGAKTNPGLSKVLEGSRFSLQVVENYKPRNLPPDARVSQLIQRRTIYGIKTIEKDLIKGENSLGIVAAGAGSPIPFAFNGPFEMYRLADLS
jgi:hypothetical protein